MLDTATPDELRSIMIDPELKDIMNKTISHPMRAESVKHE